MLLHGNDLQMLDSTGTVVGAFPVAIYEEKTVTLSTATYCWHTPTALSNRKTSTAKCSAKIA